MRRFRLWLLVLLAVLLPIRGAVAAGMLCPQEGHAPVVAQALKHPHHHEHGSAASDSHSCKLACAALCSGASALIATPLDAPPPVAGGVDFPPCLAPSPSFFSDGPERPPRTC